MRIGTSMMFQNTTSSMLDLQDGLFKLQNQLSTGRKILTPADDPVAAAQALVVSQQKAINSQFVDNQGNAGTQLAELEGRIDAVSQLLQEVRTKAVEAGNGAYDDSQRKAIAAEIRERYDELLGLANASDAMGNYVFSGFRGTTQPFSVSGSPGSRTLTYNGDDGRRQLQVGTNRIMDVSEAGSDVFIRIPQGNGVFTFAAAAANTGTGIVGDASVVTGFDGSTYQLTFTAPDTYDLTQTDPSGTVTTTTGNAYTSGNQILLGPAGQQISISISGAPAAGDVFDVNPAANQDIFSTLDQMISALEGQVATNATTRAAFANKMNSISQNLDQALNHVVTRQTSIGGRRIELDALTNVASDLDIQYQGDLSKLQDIDYTEAISAVANQKMVLEAAQATFSKVSQMSLFSFL